MKPDAPKPRKVFVKVVDVIGAPSTLDMLAQLGKITSMVPPDLLAARPYWIVDLENPTWPVGQYTEAHVTISTHKEGMTATMKAEITL